MVLEVAWSGFDGFGVVLVVGLVVLMMVLVALEWYWSWVGGMEWLLVALEFWNGLGLILVVLFWNGLLSGLVVF